jgi:hypothetical protein
MKNIKERSKKRKCKLEAFLYLLEELDKFSELCGGTPNIRKSKMMFHRFTKNFRRLSSSVPRCLYT